MRAALPCGCGRSASGAARPAGRPPSASRSARQLLLDRLGEGVVELRIFAEATSSSDRNVGSRRPERKARGSPCGLRLAGGDLASRAGRGESVPNARGRRRADAAGLGRRFPRDPHLRPRRRGAPSVSWTLADRDLDRARQARRPEEAEREAGEHDEERGVNAAGKRRRHRVTPRWKA